MRGNKLENHIFIFWNQKLWVENPKLMNMHNRLSIQSLLFANYRPIITSCQKFYTLGGEERRRIERRMSRWFTWFPISGFRRTQYITGFGLIYKEVECYLDGVWLWRISGGLRGDGGTEMLISAFRSRRSISGPELTGWTFITPKLYKIVLPQWQ